MHLPRETTLVAHNTSKPTHGTIRDSRVRAPMTVDTNELITTGTIVASRLARDAAEDLKLRLGGLVVVAVIALARRPLATIWVEVVHVAHLDLLHTLEGVPVVVPGRVDTLTFLVVGLVLWRRWCRYARNHVGLWERGDGLGKLGPG